MSNPSISFVREDRDTQKEIVTRALTILFIVLAIFLSSLILRHLWQSYYDIQRLQDRSEGIQKRVSPVLMDTDEMLKGERSFLSGSYSELGLKYREATEELANTLYNQMAEVISHTGNRRNTCGKLSFRFENGSITGTSSDEPLFVMQDVSTKENPFWFHNRKEPPLTNPECVWLENFSALNSLAGKDEVAPLAIAARWISIQHNTYSYKDWPTEGQNTRKAPQTFLKGDAIPTAEGKAPSFLDTNSRPWRRAFMDNTYEAAHKRIIKESKDITCLLTLPYLSRIAQPGENGSTSIRSLVCSRDEEQPVDNQGSMTSPKYWEYTIFLGIDVKLKNGQNKGITDRLVSQLKTELKPVTGLASVPPNIWEMIGSLWPVFGIGSEKKISPEYFDLYILLGLATALMFIAAIRRIEFQKRLILKPSNAKSSGSRSVVEQMNLFPGWQLINFLNRYWLNRFYQRLGSNVGPPEVPEKIGAQIYLHDVAEELQSDAVGSHIEHWSIEFRGFFELKLIFGSIAVTYQGSKFPRFPVVYHYDGGISYLPQTAIKEEMERLFGLDHQKEASRALKHLLRTRSEGCFRLEYENPEATYFRPPVKKVRELRYGLQESKISNFVLQFSKWKSDPRIILEELSPGRGFTEDGIGVLTKLHHEYKELRVKAVVLYPFLEAIADSKSPHWREARKWLTLPGSHRILLVESRAQIVNAPEPVFVLIREAMRAAESFKIILQDSIDPKFRSIMVRDYALISLSQASQNDDLVINAKSLVVSKNYDPRTNEALEKLLIQCQLTWNHGEIQALDSAFKKLDGYPCISESKDDFEELFATS